MTVYVADRDMASLCECGCGELAPIAPYSHAARGWVKGQPKRFVTGHNARVHKARRPEDSYTVEDRGFETPCWIWNGYLDPNGYGRIGSKTTSSLAHRWFYEQTTGPLILGHEFHHRCTVHSCVRPDHLQQVTHAEHTKIEAAARTSCRRGHLYAEHGSIRPDGNRKCRACARFLWHRRRLAAVA